jgi:imidazoleglycerol-phosphate dehydratase
MSDDPIPVQPVRRASVSRQTNESDIALSLCLDGAGSIVVETGLPFFDHMLTQLGRHGGFDLEVHTKGDLEVDAHHSVEDTGIVFGEALRQALGDKAGIRRFASLALPLDEALIEVALDCSGRPFLHYDVTFGADQAALGNPGFDPQLAEEFFRALCVAGGLTMHLSLRYGKNAHHIVEASFKAVARALRDAVRREGTAIPSTKGVL